MVKAEITEAFFFYLFIFYRQVILAILDLTTFEKLSNLFALDFALPFCFRLNQPVPANQPEQLLKCLVQPSLHRK